MVTIKYFGVLTEYAKVNEEKLPLNDLTLLQLVENINDKYQINETAFRVAVNQKMIVDLGNCVLNSNDVVALLPPFSGG